MSDATVAATEEAVAGLIASRYAEGLIEAAEVAEAEQVKFEFDAGFQTKIAAFVLRDSDFLRRVGHLLKPSFFENAAEAALVNIALEHFKRYKSAPSKASSAQTVRDMVKGGVFRGGLAREVPLAWKELYSDDMLDGNYVETKVVEFARHQAVSQAILASVGMLEKRQFDKIEKLIGEAVSVAANDEGESTDYWKLIAERTAARKDKVSGKHPPTGITTGNIELDDLLYHKGWGKRELTSIMGGAKAGKTTALINFAKSASVAGHNVLYVTLEVGAKIISDRLDASLSDVAMKDLLSNINEVERRISAIKHGELRIDEFASGTLSPNKLRALLDRYASEGIKFELIVVDYADIMAPNFRTQDPIENSKTVYVDLRAIAFEYDAAVLTATQTNREGFKSTVAKAEHVSEDFNKVRTVDLMISINSTEEERSRGEARLYFAASRNQESGFTVHIEQELAKMQFMKRILRIE